MSKTIKLKKGFNLNLAGKPEKKITEISQPETFAIKPTDFIGVDRPKLLVKEGDNVKAGSPIFYVKPFEDVKYVSPVSGEVVEIKRGEKRKVLEIKILADKTVEYESFKSYSVSDLAGLSREEIVNHMSQGGVWPSLIQRPYGVIASPEDTPKSIFISAFDSSPLAADYAFILQGKEQYFQAGLDVLKKLTPGLVHLNIDGDAEVAGVFSQAQGVEINKISGAHPAGNVGVQIHHLDPVNKGDIVWTTTPYFVAQIGRLFIEGKYDASKLVAIAGNSVSAPAYVKTYIGAQAGKLAEGNVESGKLRYISGNVLTGEAVGKDGYLGYYHNQISVIPEGDYEEFLGWILPSSTKLSFHKAFGLLSFLGGKKEFKVDTNTHGEQRSFVVTGAFEKVLPMDILPTYLFKAVLANDYDGMEALGIFEVIEEDVALCEYIDPSKNDLQKILRKGIDLVQHS
ncbi:Na(+)-translocating NADH-quinone reductase subunit A [Marinoscillum sp. MHG1-6]|uniref:Na(+)-translocating NADH-quinone reductase subunit A n=1 Tax=Marinoscillum sp. MHG1-6 TaxID=2959627 RepID=UPI0021570100|nr:Na(+)-translocating NADH-quinone reductase subunit A [Marinoscillum sp. MHG1-6]